MSENESLWFPECPSQVKVFGSNRSHSDVAGQLSEGVSLHDDKSRTSVVDGVTCLKLGS